MTNMAETEREAAHWLARRDADTWAQADEAQFGSWLEASTTHRVAFLRLQEAWN